MIYHGGLQTQTSYALALSMVAGGWIGLLVGNRVAHIFKDPTTLTVATLFFLLCGSVLMEAAGFDSAVQETVSLAVGVVAVAVATLASMHFAWRKLCGRRRPLEVGIQEQGGGTDVAPRGGRDERAQALLGDAG